MVQISGAKARLGCGRRGALGNELLLPFPMFIPGAHGRSGGGAEIQFLREESRVCSVGGP